VSDAAPLLPWLAAPLAQGLALRAHALLLHGPGGVGQFELGLALATGWLCETDADLQRPDPRTKALIDRYRTGEQ